MKDVHPEIKLTCPQGCPYTTVLGSSLEMHLSKVHKLPRGVDNNQSKNNDGGAAGNETQQVVVGEDDWKQYAQTSKVGGKFVCDTCALDN